MLYFQTNAAHLFTGTCFVASTLKSPLFFFLSEIHPLGSVFNCSQVWLAEWILGFVHVKYEIVATVA